MSAGLKKQGKKTLRTLFKTRKSTRKLSRIRFCTDFDYEQILHGFTRRFFLVFLMDTISQSEFTKKNILSIHSSKPLGAKKSVI